MTSKMDFFAALEFVFRVLERRIGVHKRNSGRSVSSSGEEGFCISVLFRARGVCEYERCLDIRQLSEGSHAPLLPSTKFCGGCSSRCTGLDPIRCFHKEKISIKTNFRVKTIHWQFLARLNGDRVYRSDSEHQSNAVSCSRKQYTHSKALSLSPTE